MSFQDQNLHEGILKAIDDAGYTSPTPIQEMVIPKILSGQDIRASAQTGTGKTAAFLLPALQRLTVPSTVKGNGPRILVLVPTRELAMQVANEAVKYSKYLSRAKTVCIYGGAPYPVQNRQLARPYEILVATPGRLIDHLERGKINFSRLEMLILDEADRMLDMGFIGPVEQIADATPKDRQTLMFSATLKGSVMNLSKKLLNNPVEIEAEHSQSHVDNIEQRLHQVDNLSHKNRLLEQLLIDPLMNQAIIFTSTKRHAEEMVGMLHDMGHSTAALHGDMNQRQRTRTIMRLRQEEIKVLVATDVAARGIDVQTISHVINFDLPMGVEDYVHRIGRTGRAGAKGIAITFASNKDMSQVKRIEQFTKQKMTVHVIPGYEPTVKDKGSDGKRSRGRSGGERSGDRRSREPRSEHRDFKVVEREPRTERREPRAERSERFVKTERSESREDRPARFPKAERSEGRPARFPKAERSEGREDRPPRFAKTDRGEGRPARFPKAERSEGREDRPPRFVKTDRGEGRPARFPKAERSEGREDRPPRFAKTEGSEGRPPRFAKTDRGEGRPARFPKAERSEGREDRPARFPKAERGEPRTERREFSDKPKFGSKFERPKSSFQEKKSFGGPRKGPGGPKQSRFAKKSPQFKD